MFLPLTFTVLLGATVETSSLLEFLMLCEVVSRVKLLLL
jgi:hypothetical protein